jgi:cell division septation protein DedD
MPWAVISVAVLGAAAAFATVVLLSGGERPTLTTSAQGSPTVAGVTQTTPPPTPGTAAPTPPPTPPPSVEPAAAKPSMGWFVVVSSGRKPGSNPNNLARAIAAYGERGRVIDTDQFRTGRSGAPEYLPSPGVYAAVVGPFGSFDAAREWCGAARPGQTCFVRQLFPV